MSGGTRRQDSCRSNLIDEPLTPILKDPVLILTVALGSQLDAIGRRKLVSEPFVLRPVCEAIRRYWTRSAQEKWTCPIGRHVQEVTDSEENCDEPDIHRVATYVTAIWVPYRVLKLIRG